MLYESVTGKIYMTRIIAIGGGEIGRPKKNGGFYPIETTAIDTEIVRASGKKHPQVLFLPTASSDSESYFKVVQKYFGTRLGCMVDVLYLTKSPTNIKKKINSADIIYVGGGNTLKMMKLWRRLGVDILLKNAAKKGVILSGLSAGSICWFREGCSDSLSFTSGSTKMIKVKGLNVINALHCPHYDSQERKRQLKPMMKKTKGVAIAVTNCAAIDIKDDTYRIIKSKPSAKVYKIYWKKGTYVREELTNKEFKPLQPVLVR